MNEIADEDSQHHGFPDTKVRGGAQNHSFIEGEEEITGCELVENNLRWEGVGGCGSGRRHTSKIIGWEEMREDCAIEGGSRLDVEKEDTVGERDGRKVQHFD